MYRMPSEMADELSRPMGTLHSIPPQSLRESRCIATIGDRTTLAVAQEVCQPHLAIVDFKTRRHTPVSASDRVILESICAQRVLRVNNPAGGITRELWNAVAATAEQRIRTRIEVDGEEDLATLAVLALCPDGTEVLYGQPGQGVVHLTLDRASRRRAQGCLDRMQET